MSPYAILGVQEGAPLDTVKSAYRKLVKKYHPDVSTDPAHAVKFQEVQDAYDAITQPKAPPQPPRPNFHFTTVLETMVEVSVEEAFHGGHKTLNIGTPTGKHLEISVEIPPMTVPGTRLKVNGLPPELSTVDLYIIVMPSENGAFRAMGTTIVTRLAVDFVSAILGAEVSVQTLDGTRFFKIVPGSQNGAMVKLNNLGFRFPGAPNGERDDFVVILDIMLPTQINEAQRQLLTQYRDLT